jgi:hypothetical protein
MDCNGDGLADLATTAPDYRAAVNLEGRVEMHFSCPASAQNLGSGWPGTLVVPQLDLTDPVHGTPGTLTLGNSSGVPTAALVFVGAASGAFPSSAGGTLYLVPLLTFVVGLPAGGLSLPVTIADPPGHGGCSDPVYLQAIQPDSGSSHGLAFTPALEIIHGNLPIR